MSLEGAADHIGTLEEFKREYTLHEEVGRGNFSVVRRGRHKKTGQEVAVKILSTEITNLKKRTLLSNELSILRQADHPAIVSLKGVYETKKKILVVTSYASGGELFDRIVRKSCYSEADAAAVIQRILSALIYLHHRNIVHRDLKPENLLLRNKDDDTDVLLADFGLSRILHADTLAMTACGSPSYVAPEVLNASGYGPKVDTWAVGVITYVLLCGYPPFYGERVQDLLKSVLFCRYEFVTEDWKRISAEAKDFVRSLLVLSPKERLDAQQALDHPWIRRAQCTASLGASRLRIFAEERQRTRKRLQSDESLDKFNDLEDIKLAFS